MLKRLCGWLIIIGVEAASIEVGATKVRRLVVIVVLTLRDGPLCPGTEEVGGRLPRRENNFRL